MVHIFWTQSFSFTPPPPQESLEFIVTLCAPESEAAQVEEARLMDAKIGSGGEGSGDASGDANGAPSEDAGDEAVEERLLMLTVSELKTELKVNL